MTKREEYMKDYNKAYYDSKKETRKAFIIARQKEIKDTVQSYKISKGCYICGYHRCGRALQFHHTGEESKDANISRMVGSGRKLSAIFKEIEKCVVICSNCHAELHEGFFGDIC